MAGDYTRLVKSEYPEIVKNSDVRPARYDLVGRSRENYLSAHHCAAAFQNSKFMTRNKFIYSISVHKYSPFIFMRGLLIFSAEETRRRNVVVRLYNCEFYIYHYH